MSNGRNLDLRLTGGQLYRGRMCSWTRWRLCRHNWNAVWLVRRLARRTRIPQVRLDSPSHDLEAYGLPHSSLKTRDLAFLTQGFVFVNIGMTLIIIITLLAVTGRDNMHSATYVFTQTYNCKSTGCVLSFTATHIATLSHWLAKQRSRLHVWSALGSMDNDRLRRR